MKWLFSLLFGLAGLGALAMGVGWGIQRYSLYQSGATTQGTVVEIVQEEHYDSQRRLRTYIEYYPVVEFVAQDGQTVRFRGSIGSSSPAYTPGTQVTVRYEPANPANAALYDFRQFWLGPIAVTFGGLLFMVLSPLLFIAIGRSESQIRRVLSQTKRQSDSGNVLPRKA